MSTINTHSASTKTYCLIDKNQKFYMSSYQANGEFQKSIQLTTLVLDQPENIRAYQVNIEQITLFKKQLEEVAPIDIRVFMDNKEIFENEAKAELIEPLVIYEFRTDTKSALKTLSNQAIQAAKTEHALRTQMSSMFANMNRKVGSGGFSIAECKKLQTTFKDLQG